MPLLDVNNLATHFHTRHGVVRAVDGVSFSLEAGETLGIVGESGSGKSVTCYSLLGLLPMPPARIESGTAHFGGIDLLACTQKELRGVRGSRISMIFQDPMTCLNPYLRISTQLIEPLLHHARISKPDALDRAVKALDDVGIPDAARRIRDYPHEFSGGMRQRVMIAMGLLTRPEVLIADEPTTALDVTVQAQILDLIRDRQRELQTAVILVTHDLGVVSAACDRVMVMYAGRIMESGSIQNIFHQTQHPYTHALQCSLPSLHRQGERLQTIPGMPPELTAVFPGCPFAPRCEFATDICARPTELLQTEKGHFTACTRAQMGEISLM
ncbi:MAG: ABC transporter ATP-binding protein [Lentisphaerae bacterium]|jgi:oligopeptide transport system ATP-binding protein|nr:ABC transporter ATP-binding protein [Lentisphaerota bacterium]MBT4815537.1 ABC transporter ATP-binding protein [Lentisphaerota bacterium]MBT5605427.1 ABC transporter ATP-binding protein [Lentisphaerota bacterium]MBT7060142.1 ABC transporter ATP-binding protein [Lentisphaerota bacterium]MBT7840798.1 ABC transporter ATP-binding protein [Lentisphaerota bacterium]